MFKPACLPSASARALPSQRGSALLFSLMGLVVLMIGAMALIRSVSTGSLVIGNIGFKQDATVSADRATRQAISWLSGSSGLTANGAAYTGYYATNLDGLDATGTQIDPSSTAYATRSLVDWDGNNCASAASGTYASCLKPATINLDASDTSSTKSTAGYIVSRLCLSPGSYNATGNTCAQPHSVQGGPGETYKRGALSYADYLRLRKSASSSTSSIYYRIIVRVVGARNAVSYTETIVQF